MWPWNLTDDLEQGKSEGFDSCDRPSNLKLDSNSQFFCLCDREIWWMTLKNNRRLLLYYVKLCASFQIHWWIQTGFTVQKHSIRVEIGDMLSRVTQEIWWMTLENNRAPLLFYFKLCAAFRSHWWIQLELQSWNAQSGSNSMIFWAVWPCNLTYDIEQGKSEGFDSCDRPSNLTQIGFKSSIFQPVWPWNLMDDLEKLERLRSEDTPHCLMITHTTESYWIPS